MSNEKYELHLANPPKPARVTHPATGELVGSWSYVVGHKTTGAFGRVKLHELFDFATRQVVTLDADSVVRKIESFDDPARQADVSKAFQWLNATHRDWRFKL